MVSSRATRYVSASDRPGRIQRACPQDRIAFRNRKERQFVNPLTEALGTHHKVSPQMRALFDNCGRIRRDAQSLPQMGGHFSPPHATASPTLKRPAVSVPLPCYPPVAAAGSCPHDRSGQSGRLSHYARTISASMRPEIITELFDLPRPRVIAHRGASGDHPENTFAAFFAARDNGWRPISNW